jgi:chorismate-pyruvate lyase
LNEFFEEEMTLMLHNKIELNWYGRLLLNTTDSMTKTLELIHNTKIEVSVIDQHEVNGDFPELFQDIVSPGEKFVLRESFLFDSHKKKKIFVCNFID